MEKKIIKKDVYKEVFDKTIDVEVFETKDGKRFDDESKAQHHEAKLISIVEFDKKYQRSRMMIGEEHYDIIFVDSLDKQSLLEIHYEYKLICLTHLKLGINMIYFDSSGDYNYEYVTHPEELIKENDTEIKRCNDANLILKDLINKYDK